MIALASDHVGIELKKHVILFLGTKKLEYRDFGAFDTEKCDYPRYALLAAKAVSSGECDRGLLFCGTGVGMSLSANKVRGIRCVVCSEPYSALLSRQHNDANMLALGARVVGWELAIMIVDTWLNGVFEGGRHDARVRMIDRIERGESLG
jgi:ribose 5-phosphate isomerase B